MSEQFSVNPGTVRRIQHEVKALYDISLGEIFATELTEVWYNQMERDFHEFLQKQKGYISELNQRERIFNSEPPPSRIGARVSLDQVNEFRAIYEKQGGTKLTDAQARNLITDVVHFVKLAYLPEEDSAE